MNERRSIPPETNPLPLGVSDLTGVDVRSWTRGWHRPIGVLLMLLVTVAAGCQQEPEVTVIRIGAGTTGEQQVLAALTAEVLARKDVPAEIVAELGDSGDVRDEALAGRVDVYWDYSGAAWAVSLGALAPPVDPVESFEAVAAEEAENGLEWMGPPQMDARLAFFVPSGAVPAGIDPNLSWLAGALVESDGALCADAEYLSAPSGYAYLADSYAISAQTVTTSALPGDEALRGIAEGRCQTALSAQGSGLARSLGLTALRDDLGVFPAQTVSAVIVQSGRADQPAPRDAVSDLAARLTTDDLANLNAAVELGEAPDVVASAFLDARDPGE